MQLSVMVRGGEALNDVTEADARYVGIDQVAQIISNGPAVAGTVYELLPPDAKRCVDEADVILSKGQGNYETFANHGFCAFYLFLCKCDLFTELFDVPKLTGMFIEQS